MRIKILILAFCFSSVLSFSQEAIIKFDTTTHNFGKIKEEGGNVVFTFFFTNTGTDTLQLKNVKPSCGCTTADWTKEPLLPGQKGYIKAEYNPKNRVGEFHKTITVTSNASVPTQMLVISGDVLPRIKDYKDTFIYASGNLRMKSNHIAFMDIKNNETRTDTLDIMNDWTKPMKLSVKSQLAYASCTVTPLLNPKEKGMIILTYDATKRNDWGLVYDYIVLNTNDETDSNKTITISANILENFSALTDKQKQKAPKVNFDTLTFNYGTVKESDTVKYSFKFRNTGQSDLVIRKIKSSCGCLTAKLIADNPVKKKKKDKSLLQYTIGKGSSGRIDIEFYSIGRKGDQHKTITVITNDPDNSVITLNVKGKVADKSK